MRILPGKARIVCTLGPASHDVGVLTRMIEVGMDVARLNFSHGSHADHAQLDRDRARGCLRGAAWPSA